jgi:Fic family protein
MWIHEHNNWPNFTWDFETLASKLASVRYKQGRLLGKMENIGFDLRKEANLNTLTNDVIKSSIIEGENLNKDEVRSSIARSLGIKTTGLISSSRSIDGIVEMMLDATQKFSSKLTKDRLFDWHAALFPTGRSGMHKIDVSRWRTGMSGDMQIISGPIGKEKIHFQAPKSDKLESEMQKFLQWFETKSDTDPVLKAGIAHLWFVTIHPFEDGNGRIARAIADMALARADGTCDRFYSLSFQIEKERKDYYNQLERQQRQTLDISNWLAWFLDCLGRAITNSEDALSAILFKAKLWERISKKPVCDRQRIVINRMLEADFKGYMNTSKYAKLTKCSSDTALRDINELTSWDVLIKNPSGGRSTSYKIK